MLQSTCCRIILLATLAACRGTEPEGLRLDISLDKTALVSTDSVRVSLRLTNMSPHVVKVLPSEAYGICFRALEVQDALHRPVSIMEGFCLAALSIWIPDPINLVPGQHITIVDWWHPGTSVLDGKPLAPGLYRVRGRAAGDDRAIHSARRSVTLLD